jgi:hypothetical protein
MKLKNEEPEERGPSLPEKIRAAFTKKRTILQHVIYCRGKELFPPEFLEDGLTKYLVHYTRHVLGRVEVDGLPSAGPTVEKQDGYSVWARRDLWTYEDYCRNYSYRVHLRESIDVNVEYLRRECRDRYGKYPKRVEV